MTRVVKVMTIREGAPVACRYFDKAEALHDYLRELTDDDTWQVVRNILHALDVTMENAELMRQGCAGECQSTYMMTIPPRALYYRENGVLCHEEDAERAKELQTWCQPVMYVYPPLTFCDDTGNAARIWPQDGEQLTIDRPSGREPITPMELEAMLAMMGGYNVEGGVCPTLLPERLTIIETDNDGNRLSRGEYGKDDADLLLREIQARHDGFRTQLYQMWQVLSMRVPFFMRQQLAKESIGVRVGGNGKTFLLRKGNIAHSSMRTIGRLSPTLWRKNGQPEEYEREGKIEYGYRVRVQNKDGVLYLNW